MKSAPLKLKSLLIDESDSSGWIISAGCVPSVVPSLFQIQWLPYVGPAVKYSAPSKLVKLPGDESDGPGAISLSSSVPLAVPSVRQSSLPMLSSCAVKYVIPPIVKNPDGSDPHHSRFVWVLISLTRRAASTEFTRLAALFAWVGFSEDAVASGLAGNADIASKSTSGASHMKRIDIT